MIWSWKIYQYVTKQVQGDFKVGMKWNEFSKENELNAEDQQGKSIKGFERKKKLEQKSDFQIIQKPRKFDYFR